ncbi:MAG: phosphatidate cytidylyltransferase [Candidatus Pelagibacter sp.]|tara:strand:- start:344 stop:1000 length:657 start_codon:yes stop_codon:yes gene_type:complete
MKSELFKRTISSFVLMILIFFCALVSDQVFLSILFIAMIFSWIEWIKIIEKINFKKIYRTINIIFFLLYLFLAFIICFNIFVIDKYFFLTILMICVFSDIGGYVFGKIFGGKKLTKISPNKTISGSIGSFTLSYLGFFLIYYYFNNLLFVRLDFEVLFFIPLIISSICQLGDLFISFYKRKAKIKNTGNLIPGHGGLLDRIDGSIFALPIGFIIISLL